MIASRPSLSAAQDTPFMARSPRRDDLGSTRAKPAVPPSAPQKHLDVFANPNPERDYLIQFVVPEFTCNCPLTGQPDFASFTIEMVADALCVELKSLKLYFWSYRDTGAFHEKVTNSILDDIVAATKPRFVRITARWNVRGGIYTNVVAEHRKKGWAAPAPVALPTPAGSPAPT
jgi:7-cyano-7-deazaguanine reductase